jgi:hypothetical protein
VTGDLADADRGELGVVDAVDSKFDKLGSDSLVEISVAGVWRFHSFRSFCNATVISFAALLRDAASSFCASAASASSATIMPTGMVP